MCTYTIAVGVYTAVCICVCSVYFNKSSGDVCIYVWIYTCTVDKMHLGISTAVYSAMWMWMCVCTVNSICTNVYLPLCLSLSCCMRAWNSVWIFIVLSCILCVFVSVWNYQYLPNPSSGVAAGCTRERKGTMNDIDRQRAAERLPVPGTPSWSLIADVSNCGRVGHPGYISVSSVSACQEAKPPPEPPITASNYRPYLCQSPCLLLSSVACCTDNRVTGPGQDGVVVTEDEKEDRQAEMLKGADTRGRWFGEGGSKGCVFVCLCLDAEVWIHLCLFRCCKTVEGYKNVLNCDKLSIHWSIHTAQLSYSTGAVRG